MYGYGFYGLDPTFLLVIAGLAISGIASAYVNSTFRKYDKIRSKNNVTGTQAAQFILQSQKINNVGVQQIAGDLTDNYNSGNKMLSLSQATAQSTSVAAIGVAAHECGHAVQDAVGYAPLKIRASLVPVANFGSMISFPLIMVGVLFSWNTTLINIGIFAFSLALLFQLVTLPVEFNASRRAIQILSEGGLLTEEEVPMAKHVLFAAALTYVAAALSTFLQLLRLILIFGGNRRD
ncbi:MULTISPECIES: zinc metallopeptidase [Enterococcus]|uniref:Zn-dependent protease n=1 Tax=Enterococcus mundtii TaxID=53346 RepID=A0AAI8RB67_ENTMU|nr:zinc metallopeptidase [Enterococcus mundtii]EOH60781.1 Zn-dependent protease [Enterococcus mundtii ATCC 882]EOU11995.1 Zn-dependent protease [Enterococcus mundtii ATCC 882]MBE9911529.1 zinc metallopeptidase [Enterococcus mundtii]MBO1086735.1 zinc metallopeptidase [Enterococcus mundtii]MCA6774387.1 zinc metallopeptidase [Enterococcus mundtii]